MIKETEFKSRLYSDTKDKLETVIKTIETNKIWTQPKSKVKLSLGAIPTHQFENSWGRYSFSKWITHKNDELIIKDLSDELNEDHEFKGEIEDISFQEIIQRIVNIYFLSIFFKRYTFLIYAQTFMFEKIYFKALSL